MSSHALDSLNELEAVHFIYIYPNYCYALIPTAIAIVVYGTYQVLGNSIGFFGKWGRFSTDQRLTAEMPATDAEGSREDRTVRRSGIVSRVSNLPWDCWKNASVRNRHESMQACQSLSPTSRLINGCVTDIH